MTFLAIDIGNTRLKWAQYASPQPGATLLNQGAVFLETIDGLADKEWGALPAPGSMLSCSSTRRFTPSPATTQPSMLPGAGRADHSLSARLSMVSRNTAP